MQACIHESLHIKVKNLHLAVLLGALLSHRVYIQCLHTCKRETQR